MSKKIVGKQNVDYVSKKTGQPVTGVTLHCVGESSRVEGMECETIFLFYLCRTASKQLVGCG